MRDDDMPTGSEIFEADMPARIGRLSFLAAASTLLLGLFAATSAHAEPEPSAKGQGARDAKRRKKAAAHSSPPPPRETPCAKCGGIQDARKKRK